MTNEDVIKKLDSTQAHIVCISADMDKFIEENYKRGNSEGKFYKVYREGTDAKYAHYMINPHTMCRRSSTFSEFYGGGIVD